MKKNYGINLVHALDADSNLLAELATGYRHKTSSITKRQQIARDKVLQRRMQAEGNKRELLGIWYGLNPKSDDGKLLMAGVRAGIELANVRHTTKGGFSHLHSNPLICK